MLLPTIIQSSSKNISSCLCKATGSELIIPWPYKNHSNKTSSFQCYKYILGSCWSELTELFPGRWSPKYLHIISGLKISMLWLLFSFHFLAQPECKKFRREYWKSLIKQQSCGEEWWDIKLLKFYFYFVSILFYFTFILFF